MPARVPASPRPPPPRPQRQGAGSASVTQHPPHQPHRQRSSHRPAASSWSVSPPEWAREALEQRPSAVYALVPACGERSDADEMADATPALRDDVAMNDQTAFTFQRDTRESALETLPLCFPPIRYRRGEHPGEYESAAAAAAAAASAGSGGEGIPAALAALPWAADCATHLEWTAAERGKAAVRASAALSAAVKPELLRAVESIAVGLEASMLDAMSRVCRQGVHAAPRGLAVPYQWYERVSVATLDAVTDIFSAAVDHHEASHSEVSEVGCGGSSKPQLTVEAAAAKVEVVTAISAAILWRMLEQVAGAVAGMRAALPLLQNLLRVVYADFERVQRVMPEAASVADQVAQLAQLRVSAVERDAARVDAERLLHDAHYLRRAMQNWSFQIWKQQLAAERRRGTFLARLDGLIDRQVRRQRLLLTMGGWKRFLAMKKFTASFRGFERSIGDVLAPELRTRRRARRSGGEADRTSQRREARGDAGLGEAEKEEVGEGERGHLQQWQQQDHAGSHRKGAPTRDASGADDDDDAFVTPEDIVKVFSLVVTKANELRDITGYLRQQIAMQRERITKLEHENEALGQKLHATEGDLLRTVREKLAARNEVEALRAELLSRGRQVNRLKSRIRSQRHKHWRRAAVQLIAEVAEVDANVRHTQRRGRGAIAAQALSGHPQDAEKSGAASLSASGEQQQVPSPCSSDLIGGLGGSGGMPASMKWHSSSGALSDGGSGSEDDDVIAEERDFASRAPLVFRCTGELPPALNIVRDWANNCLSDLCALDGSRIGVDPSTQVSEFGAELKDGSVYMRLLFYLALPRYAPRAQPSSALFEVSERCDVNRQRLLERRSVQLHPPFPTFTNCFADLLRLPYHQRAAKILHFAHQLMARGTRGGGGDPSGGGRGGMARALAHLVESEKATESAPAGGAAAGGAGDAASSLLEFVSPVALAEGMRGPHVTLLALLYVRFAHPFNHKCNAHIEAERDELLAIVEKADTQSMCRDGYHVSDNDDGDNDDERTPWQLFLDRCAPLVCSGSHSFVLDGNFWPADIVESAEMLRVFGRIITSLQRSLEVHRWHVTLQCLTTSRAYSGNSRLALAPALGAPDLRAADLVMRVAERVQRKRQLEGIGTFITGNVVGDLNAVILDLLVERGEVPAVPTAAPAKGAVGPGRQPSIVTFRAFVDDTSPLDEDIQQQVPLHVSGGAAAATVSGTSSLSGDDTPRLFAQLSETAQPPRASASLPLGALPPPPSSSSSSAAVAAHADATPGRGLPCEDSCEAAAVEGPADAPVHVAAIAAVRHALLSHLSDFASVFLQYATTTADPDTPQLSRASFRALCIDARVTPQLVSLEQLSAIFSECDHAFRSRATSLASNLTFDDIASSMNMRSSRRGSSARQSAAPSILESAPRHVRDMSFEEALEGFVRLAAAAQEAASKAVAQHEAEVQRFQQRQQELLQLDAVTASAGRGRGSLLSASGLLPPLGGGGGARRSVTPSSSARHSSVIAGGGTQPQVQQPPGAAPEDPFGATLADAVRALAARFFAPLAARGVDAVLDTMLRGSETAHVLRVHNAALLSIFNAYARVVGGAEGLDVTAFAKLVKDASLVTHEFNHGVCNELFATCSASAAAAAVTSSGDVNAASWSPGSLPLKTGGKRVLRFDRFVALIGVIAQYKNPNPFLPFAARLDAFLAQLVASLRSKVELLERERAHKQHAAQLTAGRGPAAVLAGAGLRRGAGGPSPSPSRASTAATGGSAARR